MTNSLSKCCKAENKVKNSKKPKSVTTYPQMFSYWGSGGSTQYKYSEKELLYLTQGV